MSVSQRESGSQTIDRRLAEAADREEMARRYRETRTLSLELCGPLAAEEFRAQSMPDVSPPWWNLGHTSWFFAKNVLEPRGLAEAEDARLEYVLNSYYEALGPRLPRADRGKVSRPTTERILAYRATVDERVERLLTQAPADDLPALAFLVRTGVEHEQQHQELLVTEVKHIMASNEPGLRTSYAGAPPAVVAAGHAVDFLPVPGGVVEIGHREDGWCWDNELPSHRAWVADFLIADRLVTNAEYEQFVLDGGYDDPLLWLANGWARCRELGWRAPLYWEGEEGAWSLWTLSGSREIAPEEPVAHLSFYEAEAFARWKSATFDGFAGVRLPTEREWEVAARTLGFDTARANLLEERRFHPRPATGAGPWYQAAGDLWEWTASHYEPYPGYRPFAGNLMEYNGKFMDNQRVLRGGSCATPRSHLRPTYRNFWPAETRFQFTGVRLARDG